MALSALITWEVRPSGNDLNGGGFKTGASGTDYSIQDAAQFSGTDLAVDAVTNTKVTSATHTFAGTDVGNLIQIVGGGAWTAGCYEIVSVSGGAAVLDRSPAAVGSTVGTWKLGGGLASPGKAGGLKVANNDVFIKNGTYTLSTTTPNIAGGPVDDTTGAADTANSKWTGYDTNRNHVNADANRPTILVPASSVTSITIFTDTGLNVRLHNLIVDGANKSAIRGFDANPNFGSCILTNCKAQNCTNRGISCNGFSYAIGCEITGCSVSDASAALVLGAGSSSASFCYIHDNTCTGVYLGSNTSIDNCISESNSGGGSYGFYDTSGAAYIRNCIAYNNGLHGFYAVSTFGRGTAYLNCISVSNSGWGFSASAPSECINLINCAYKSNSSGNVDTTNITTPEMGSILLTVDPFVDSANGDFSINNTAGGGAGLRGTAYPTNLPGTSNPFRRDIGTIQHVDPSGSSTVIGPMGMKVIGPSHVFI